MGNHHSQTVELNPGWSHSFPRDREKKLLKYGGIQDATPARKVLPERVPGQKLRLTTNGNILQQGGTISGRRLAAAHSFNPLTDGLQPHAISCFRSSPAPHTSESATAGRVERKSRCYDVPPSSQQRVLNINAGDGHSPVADGQRQSGRRDRSLQPGLEHNQTEEDTQKGYDSEPDLRESPEEDSRPPADPTCERQTRTLTRDGPTKARARSRKKSRAPPPPPVSELDLPPPPAMPPPPVPDHLPNRDRGRDHGQDHGRDHGREHGQDHGREHGQDHGRDRDRPRTRLFSRHGEARRPTEQRPSPRSSRAVSHQRWLPSQPQMKERQSRAQSLACIRAQAAADLVTSFSSLPRAERAERAEHGEQTAVTGDLRRSGEARHSRSEGALQAAIAGSGRGGGGTLQQAVSTEDHRITITVNTSSEDSSSAHRHAKQPSVFYFGMEPPTEKRDDDANKTSAIAKVKRNEHVAICGSAVSYSKRTAGEGRNKSPSAGHGEQKVKSPTSSRSGGHTKSPASGRSAEPVKSPSSGRSGGHTKSPGSRRSDNTANPPAVGSPASLARIPSRKLAEFVSSLERSRQKRLSVSRDEILTNSSALSCKSQSSVFDLELDAGGHDSISMHLRPTLPRKQLEIPRFSPVSAWRSLTLDRAASRPWRGADTSDISDGPEPLTTTPPRRRRPHTKSADSGISGDASSPPPPPLAASSPAPDRADGWVPAHDLDLSSGEEGPTPRHQRSTTIPPQLMSRTDMFPAAAEPPSERGERQLSPHTYNSLRQMKRSVSTAIAALRRSPAQFISSAQLSDNWMLSRSVPNSLNGVDEEAVRPSEARSDGGAPGGRHVLYLPEYHSMPLPRRADRADLADRAPGAGRRGAGRSSTDLWRTEERAEHRPQEHDEGLDRSRDDEHGDERQDEHKKEHRNERRDEHRDGSRDEHRDEIRDEHHDDRRDERRATPEKPPRTSLSTGKRRFSYQSTVRQVERRRLEARLSRLAEDEEQQRWNELRILHQVEQQFQSKRTTEQAERRGLRSEQGPLSLPVAPPGERSSGTGGSSGAGWREELENGQQQEQQHGPVSLQMPPCPPPDYTTSPPVFPGPDGPASLPATPAYRPGKQRDKQKFLSGVRNWIRARKDAPRGVDGTWQTAARLEPEGAPAVSQQDGVRHEGLQQEPGTLPEMTRQEKMRQEALSAARQRNGRPADKRKSIYKQVAEFTEDVSDLSGVNSPVSELSAEPLQTSSGYESSPPLSSTQRLTRELPEYRQEARHYSDYRAAPAARHQSPVRSPPFADVFGPVRSGRRTPAAIYSETHNRAASSDRHSASAPLDPYAEHQPLRTAPMTTNYRRAFAQGSAASPLDSQQPQKQQQQQQHHQQQHHQQPTQQPPQQPQPQPQQQKQQQKQQQQQVEEERDAESPTVGQRRKQRTKTSRRNDSFKRSLGQMETAAVQERTTVETGGSGRPTREIHPQQQHPVYGQQRNGFVGHVNSSPARFMYATDPFAAKSGYRAGHQRPAPPAARLV